MATTRLPRCPARRRSIAAHLTSAFWLTFLLLPETTAVARAQAEPLTLRVNDATGRPGDLMAVVIRTYAPRTLGQGQICLRLQSAAALTQPAAKVTSTPLAALEDAIVFDAISERLFKEPSQTAVINFDSPSGTTNQTDGPLAVLFFRIANDASPGQVFQLTVDLSETFLYDPLNQPITVEPRAGDLEIVDATAPFQLVADGNRVTPGGVARLGVATTERFEIGFGRTTFHYDPTIAAGPPKVTINPLHGQVALEVDEPVPGSLVMAFTSLDASLNSIPGEIIAIDLPISPTVPLGTLSPIWLEPEPGTFLAGRSGAFLPLEPDDGDLIEVTLSPVLFSDSFESGDLSSWAQP